MKFIVNEVNSTNGLILIVSDENIVGEKFSEKNWQLDLSKKFYAGKAVDEKELKESIKKAYILHLTGENAVKLGIELGLVDKDKVLVVQKVKHAEVVVENS